jgi:Spy/CpxP family protein refolding chaperone
MAVNGNAWMRGTAAGAMALVLAAGMAAFGQEGGGPAGRPGGGRGPGGPGGPGRDGPPLDRILNLTPDQKTAWDALRKEQREAMRPLWEEQRRLEDQLRDALEAPSPDPAAVGQRAIAAHAGRKKMKAEGDRFHQRLVDILDAQQREKLAMFEQMRQRGGGPGGMGGPEPPPPPQ